MASTSTEPENAQSTAAYLRKCTEHNQDYDTFCKTCSKPICEVCFNSQHENHNLKELFEAAAEVQNKLKQIISKMSNDMIKQDQALALIKQTKRNISAGVRAAKKRVKEAAQQIRDIINEHEEKLLHDLNHIEAKGITKVESMEQESDVHKTGTAAFIEELKTLCESGTDIDKVIQVSSMQEQFEVRKKSKLQDITWWSSFKDIEQPVESIKAMLGSIRLVSPGTIPIGDCVRQVSLAYKGDMLVSGMVVIGDCLCITHYEVPILWLYHLTTGLNRTFRLQGLSNPRGMALVKSSGQTVVITDQGSDGGKLHFVNISKRLGVSVIKTESIQIEMPEKISVSKETGELIIGQFMDTQFVICDEEGGVQSLVKVSAGDNTECYPKGVIKTGEGYALLKASLFGNNTIQWVDRDSECTHTYDGNCGDKVKRVLDMIGVQNEQIILADYDHHQLQLVDSSGRLSQMLLTPNEGLHGPQCVYLDEAAARLYVAQGPSGAREVRAYRWSAESTDSHITNYRLEVTTARF